MQKTGSRSRENLSKKRQHVRPLPASAVVPAARKAARYASNGTPGDQATYSVRDYIRSVVLRRWRLNLAKLGSRIFVIQIRVEMKRDGTIVSAEVVEKHDRLYRDIALSARNAVLLSSPILMPPGDFPAIMHFIIVLDPRDTQH